MREEPPANAPAPGTVLGNRYLVERLLGAGGMGFVIAATDQRHGQRVAIKLLLPELANDASTVERFLREANAAVKIRSDHVVRILGVGELVDRTPYLVMEYLEGADLAAVIKQGTVPAVRAVDWVLQAAEALAEAHAMKTIHRDLKPANLFLERRSDGPERIKVLDFGISKILGDGNLAMTKTATMMGSPLYMSPEQLKSARSVDERSDIWALGVILFELVAGAPPFIATTIAELGALVLSNEAPRLDSVAPNTAPGLSSVIATCLQRRPEDRFVNLTDFADALAPFGSERARDSVQRIAATLGMPAVRAKLAVAVASDRASAPTLDRTQPLHSLRPPGDSSPELLAPIPAYGVTASPRKSGGALVAIASAIFLVLLLAGGGLLYKAKPFHRASADELPQRTPTATVGSTAPQASAIVAVESASPASPASSTGAPPSANASTTASSREGNTPVAGRPVPARRTAAPPSSPASPPTATPAKGPAQSNIATDPKN